ncbi:MAG: polyprenyl synthetase family protein [candidate division Zixibacteria bacterium]|nr:polyprenyl synthetase family protein [candidate division Zixibacteria bacterium]
MATQAIDFFAELEKRERWVASYLKSEEFESWFHPVNLKEAVYSYVNRAGKRLRPAVLLLACGAVGGTEEEAIPAAAAVEMFHTWTLVHDDLIDNDEKRRGGWTVHTQSSRIARKQMDYTENQAKEYGRDIAILAGDVQQGWAVSLLCDCSLKRSVKPEVTLTLIRMLESYVLNTLVSGETLDIQFAKQPIESFKPEQIMDMLWRKTGALYEYSAKAGAMIGLNTTEDNDKRVVALSNFTSRCGTAFQLQDDILGIIGNENQLGKPVGSDIREGKRTTIIYYAFKNASPQQKTKLESVLGNQEATREEINEVTRLLLELGGISETKRMAQQIIGEARPELDVLPESHYKELLLAWADFMISRNF